MMGRFSMSHYFFTLKSPSEMKYLKGISSIMLWTIGIVVLPSNEVVKKALAIGCDTYYRVTGQIGGCTDASTEDARELWLERYSVCLQQQLSREISIHKSKVDIYYAELDKDPQQNIRFEEIVLQDEEIAPFSVTDTQSTTYRGNADFCDR